MNKILFLLLSANLLATAELRMANVETEIALISEELTYVRLFDNKSNVKFRNKFANKSLLSAKNYFSKNQFRSAVHSAREALNSWQTPPELGYLEAIYILAVSYQKMGDIKRSKNGINAYISAASRAKEAKKLPELLKLLFSLTPQKPVSSNIQSVYTALLHVKTRSEVYFEVAKAAALHEEEAVVGHFIPFLSARKGYGDFFSGISKYKKNDYEGALTSFKNASMKSEDLKTESHLAMARVYLKKKDYTKSVGHYRIAVKNEESQEAKYEIIFAYLGNQMWRESLNAIDDYQKNFAPTGKKLAKIRRVKTFALLKVQAFSKMGDEVQVALSELDKVEELIGKNVFLSDSINNIEDQWAKVLPQNEMLTDFKMASKNLLNIEKDLFQLSERIQSSYIHTGMKPYWKLKTQKFSNLSKRLLLQGKILVETGKGLILSQVSESDRVVLKRSLARREKLLGLAAKRVRSRNDWVNYSRVMQLSHQHYLADKKLSILSAKLSNIKYLNGTQNDEILNSEIFKLKNQLDRTKDLLNAYKNSHRINVGMLSEVMTLHRDYALTLKNEINLVESYVKNETFSTIYDNWKKTDKDLKNEMIQFKTTQIKNFAEQYEGVDNASVQLASLKMKHKVLSGRFDELLSIASAELRGELRWNLSRHKSIYGKRLADLTWLEAQSYGEKAKNAKDSYEAKLQTLKEDILDIEFGLGK